MPIFVELSLILMVTTVIAFLMRLIKQPLVVGYIVSGIVVGPYVLDILKSTEYIELFSKIGIAVLLFIVGLSLNPKTIKENGSAALTTGIGQIVFTSVFGCLIVLALGYDVLTSLYVAIALTFSSTIIILKLLSDRGDLGKLYGRISIGFLLAQDLVATVLLVFIPILGAYIVGGGETEANFYSLVLLGVAAGLLVLFITKFIIKKIINNIAKTPELLFLFSITWGLLVAALFYSVGLSVEVGALIAGVTLSVTNFAFEISSKLKPLRDFFIVLFFILLGSQLVLGDLQAIILPATILSVFVLVGNPLIVFILMNLLGYKSKVGFMAGLTVAQISEFSLILMHLGQQLGHVSAESVSLVTMVGIVTIAGSTYLILYADGIYKFLEKFLRILEIRKIKKGKGERKSTDIFDVVIFGYGNVGNEFVRVAKENNNTFAVVDYDPSLQKKNKATENNFIYGDAEDVEFLEEIKVVKSKILVSTIPDPQINLSLIKYYRKKNKEGVVVVTSHGVEETKELYAAGATYVIMPHFLGAHHAALMLSRYINDEEVFAKARETQMHQLEKVRL